MPKRDRLLTFVKFSGRDDGTERYFVGLMSACEFASYPLAFYKIGVQSWSVSERMGWRTSLDVSVRESCRFLICSALDCCFGSASCLSAFLVRIISDLSAQFSIPVGITKGQELLRKCDHDPPFSWFKLRPHSLDRNTTMS